MAIDTFTWRTQIQNGMEGQFNHRVRSVQFGDGYKQVSGDGINPETQSWPISMAGRKSDMLPALAFIRGHTVRSFIWTPPFGSAGLYRVVADSIRLNPMSSNTMTITATFEQAFSP
ncbi:MULTISPECIES: phage tail protein [unclassified Erwinia]|uniref:phage tail protein n=1 Tax=unclassified Erwinia TaxID=2622719 RepID=UPI000C18EA49|nr:MULTISPECIES: phage tail protein [unclassified Erwinia]PIJ49203.1 phage tail protein [Erwinia sp. OAMSP11]PIJ79890.1 phage tail protein [Erwinia sp. OLCASP19]PIJ81058.1 phage tail protein [Erwinia sp. OLMTSP26]PIJ93114.1 phage tail protein [Erwinia sp. OLFS4]